MKRLHAALDNQPPSLVPHAARSRRTLHIVLAVILAVQIVGTAIVVGSAGDAWRLDLSASGDVEVRDFCPLPSTIFGKGEFHTIIGDPPRPLEDNDAALPPEESVDDDKRERPVADNFLGSGPGDGVPDSGAEVPSNDDEGSDGRPEEPIYISAGTMELGVFSLWLEFSTELPESYAATGIEAGSVRLIDLRLIRMIGPYAVAQETGDENGNGQPDRRIDFVLDDLFVARGGENGSSLIIVTGRAEGCDFRATGQLLVDFPDPGEGEMPGGSSGGSAACEASEDDAAATPEDEATAATPSACSEGAPPAETGGTPTAETTATATPACFPTPDAPCSTASPQAEPTETVEATPSVEPTATVDVTAEPTAVAEEAVAPQESTPGSESTTPDPNSTSEPAAPQPVDEPEPTTESEPTEEPETMSSPDPSEEEIATHTP